MALVYVLAAFTLGHYLAKKTNICVILHGVAGHVRDFSWRMLRGPRRDVCWERILWICYEKTCGIIIYENLCGLTEGRLISNCCKFSVIWDINNEIRSPSQSTELSTWGAYDWEQSRHEIFTRWYTLNIEIS